MLENFNVLLFVYLLIYTMCLLIGFKIQSSQKSQLNKKYKLFKPYLTFMLISIFSITAGILAFSTLINHIFSIFFTLHMLFVVYMIWGLDKNTRCWKQHKIVYYNFYLIILMYVCSLFIQGVEYLFYFIFILICIYTILEFQFAKFNLKQTLMWD